MRASRKGFCWCLGGTAPPEISYSLENGGMTLKPIQVDIPMPEDEAELNMKFSELVDELGLDKAHRDAMFGLTLEKKWQIYCSKKKEQEDPKSASWPDYYIDKITKMTTMQAVFRGNTTAEEITTRTKVADNLRTALRTQPMSFVVRFIEQDGLNVMLNFLQTMDSFVARSSVHTSMICCIKSLMNSAEGRANVLAHPAAVDIIAQSLITENIRTKIVVLEILGAMCLVPGGHKKVLSAMHYFQTYAGERTRFQTLITDLCRDTGEYQDDVSLKTAIMSFINAALKYGPGQTHLEFRLHLRYEFLMLGIQPIIDKLRNNDNTTLDRHLEFFEIVRTEDERQLAKKFETTHVDTKSASTMFELLKKKIGHSAAYPHFLSLIFHLLQMPFVHKTCLAYWQLIDKVVQQVVLHTKDGDPDGGPLEIDMKKLGKQLANDKEMKEANQKFRDLQKENDELVSKLAKKDHECEVKAEEKEELMQTLNKIKAKLEKESNALYEAKVQMSEMSNKIHELQQFVELERNERIKLEHAVNTGSLPDDAKVGLSGSSSSTVSSLISDRSVMNGDKFNFAPPPPPPPPNFGLFQPPSFIPPPPPPGGFSGPNGGGLANGIMTFARKKDIPQSSQPLKCFNWTKIPDNKVTGTIWKDIDDIKVYKTLDLEDFERNFSAYQRQDTNDIGDIFNKGMMKPARELSVIDGRRAQNCTILLSKLKMTNQELANAILSVDGQEEIPKDMCEQLLKFVPTAEEIQMLGEHEHELDQMAKADRFLFEMSRIDHYEQRLKAIYYKKKFNERMSDVKPKVEAVLEASKEVCRSLRLKKLLEVVLALGNYMNQGQRGNASGFRIASLNKIIDTKSSVNRRVTLLHYLSEIAEQKFGDLMKLEDEIRHTREASKINLTELEADVNILRTGLQELVKELAYHKNKGANIPRDKFVSVMSDFVSISMYNFSEFEDQVNEMKTQFDEAMKMFGEEPRKMQPEEFFGIFDLFVTAFSEARTDNERFRRQREEEDRRQKAEVQQRSERDVKERTKLNKKGCDDEKGEFDDLISALRTGEVFGEDIAKLKRTRRRPSAQTGFAETTSTTTRERVGIIQA